MHQQLLKWSRAPNGLRLTRRTGQHANKIQTTLQSAPQEREKSREKIKQKKRRHDEEMAEVPNPPAAKKRKKKNLTNRPSSSAISSSSDLSLESSSSQEYSPAPRNLFATQDNSQNETSLSFQQYLKVNIISLFNEI